MNREFGYLRVVTAVPPVTVGHVSENVSALLALAAESAAARADVVVFPELCLTGYTCADLFHQDVLLTAAEAGLARFAEESADFDPLFFVGVPVRAGARLLNCAAAVQKGEILGLVPKTYLPNYGEFYERRWFESGQTLKEMTSRLAGRDIPIGRDLLFVNDAAAIGVELCEDLWAPIPPSTALALAGAEVLVNLSASNDLVGKSHYRRGLVKQQSATTMSAYVYCSAGGGESTTDVVYGGHRLIAENGQSLVDDRSFSFAPEMSVADVDIHFLRHERLHNRTFFAAESAAPLATRAIRYQVRGETGDDILRSPHPLPFVPSHETDRHSVCDEIFAIQSLGLATRLRHTGLKNVVIGLSGGLDSTLALLVCVSAFERLGLPHSGIHGVTMPGFGTTDRTLGNVKKMCDQLGISLKQIDITGVCQQHFKNLGHPGDRHDVTFENVQARERTQILMNTANMVGGLVVGTGDLSEMALGWCTYNGDHMSMYAVNIGVPKTLVAFLVEHVAGTRDETGLRETLHDVLATPISPELLPPDERGLIAQKTEDVVGPYELHDFFLYYLIRRACPPRKVITLAQLAFDNTYEAAVIKKWLRMFIRRFFSQQFKRSCVPDGPKVGTIALSPRGDWRMPSDANPAEWLADWD